MSILFKNALCILRENDIPVVKRADVSIEGKYITKVTKIDNERISPEKTFEKIIDATNLLLMPGFVNTHGHAAMTLFRGHGDDLPLMDWLENKIWPLEANLTGDHVYWGTMLSIIEMLKSGTTTFTDMYFFMHDVAKAVATGGIRATLARGLIGFGDGASKNIGESEEFINAWNGGADGRIKTTLGPHAPYTCPPEYLKKVIEKAEQLQVPLQIHLAETKKEVEDCIKEYGKRPAELMEEIGLFRVPVIAAHCVHLNENDMNILAKYDVKISHNLGSNLKLGSGIAPIPAMMAKKITIGLGTDGAASNNNLDMLEEARLASLVHKGINEDSTLVNAKEALDMATIEGAKTLFLDDKIGIIKENFKADLIAFDLNKPHLTPLNDPISNIIYSSQSSDIKIVMVDGKILVEKGELTTIDEEEVYYEIARVCKEIYR